MDNEVLSEKQRNGERLFRRGLVVYYLLAILPVGLGLFVIREPFGIAAGLLFCACVIIAPFMANRGSEGWKHFAGGVGMLMAMGSFVGGCGLGDEETRFLGAASLLVFLLSCYIVKVFLVNDDVDAYMAVLRKRRQGLGGHQRGPAGGKPGTLSRQAEAGPPGAQAYSRDLTTLIDYDESAINGFYPYLFEWIDNLHFLRTPDDVIADPAKRAAIEAAVARRFRGEGWKGDGLLALLWLPSFVFPLSANIPPEGVLVWHVKQHEDGISWLLSPIPLPFDSLGPD